jgi:hypothetical protein
MTGLRAIAAEECCFGSLEIHFLKKYSANRGDSKLD